MKRMGTEQLGAALVFQALLLSAGAGAESRDPAWAEEPGNMFVAAEKAARIER